MKQLSINCKQDYVIVNKIVNKIACFNYLCHSSFKTDIMILS